MDKINFGGFQFGASLEGEEPRSPGDPFRILLIGDFGGDNQNASPTPAKIDRDTLDEVMSSIAPRVDRLLTTFDGLPIAFNPTSLDDFHPDQLFESMDIFAEMRKLKRQLKNPNLFAAAAETILGWEVIRDSTPEAEATPTDSSPPSEEMNPDYSTEGLFDSVLESSADQSDETDWNGMIGDIISSSKTQKVDPRVDELTEIVDEVTERLMQAYFFRAASVPLRPIGGR